ncbi:hypothetical protein FRC09_014730 [Ceratobasidium sp. 395]|nr:hypothetical protein FRC09_014730 [Ceratobasidium sp. 395]
MAVKAVDEEYQSDSEATEDKNKVFENKEASAPKRKRVARIKSSNPTLARSSRAPKDGWKV